MIAESRLTLSRTSVRSVNGAVVAGHRAAAEAGLQTLALGGTAVDAAVAGALVSMVAEPANCGIGGHVAGLIHLADDRRNIVLHPTRAMPSKASETMFALADGLDEWGRWRKVVDDANMVGPLAVDVPGALAGLYEASRRYGSMPWSRLVEPAVALCRDGVDVDGYTALAISSRLRHLTRDRASASIFTRDGAPLRVASAHGEGDRLVQTELGRTLTRVANEGTGVFYSGEVGSAIADHVQGLGGILSRTDMAAYEPTISDAGQSTATFQGRELLWSDGYFEPLIFNVLDQLGVAGIDPDGALYRHLVIEAMRYGVAAALEYVADPNFGPVPLEALKSTAYAGEIADRISAERASPQVELPDPWPLETRLTGQRPRGRRLAPSAGIGGTGTSHVIAADRSGSVATFNITIGGAFGSCVTVPGTGVLLNDGMISFDPEPGRAHSIRPGRKVMSFSPPVHVLEGGSPVLAFACSGGRTVISCQVQVLVGVLCHGMNIQEAVEHPRVHSELGRPTVDARIGERVLRELRRLGHDPVVVEETPFSAYFARPVAIQLDRATGEYATGISPHHRTAGVAL